jgi:sigma-70, region 4 subfamily
MIILLLSILNDEQRALVERIFHEHNIHFQCISFNIVKSEETAKDAVSAAFVKIMENIEKISDLPCPQMTAFCVTIVKNTSIDVLRQLPQSIHIDYWDNISDANVDTVLDECIQFRKRYVKQICARINIYVDTGAYHFRKLLKER